MVFDFSFVNVLYDVDWFLYAESFLWTWDEFHLVVVYDLFLCYVPYITTLVWVLIMNGCWTLSNAFFVSIDHMVFDFSFVNVVYDIDWLVYVEPSLWTWDEPHVVMVYNLFYMLLDSVGKILLRILASIFIRDIGL